MTEHSIDRELGTITEMLKRIQADLHEAGTARGALQDSVDKMSVAVAELQRDMTEVKPITERITRLQSIGIGVLLTLGLIASAIGLTAATAWEWFYSHFLQ